MEDMPQVVSSEKKKQWMLHIASYGAYMIIYDMDVWSNLSIILQYTICFFTDVDHRPSTWISPNCPSQILHPSQCSPASPDWNFQWPKSISFIGASSAGLKGFFSGDDPDGFPRRRPTSRKTTAETTTTIEYTNKMMYAYRTYTMLPNRKLSKRAMWFWQCCNAVSHKMGVNQSNFPTASENGGWIADSSLQDFLDIEGGHLYDTQPKLHGNPSKLT